ncbi:MAG: transposase [Desulfobacterales bacterium]|nr:MAG: transposase [Desulfobacterales bacterium]
MARPLRVEYPGAFYHVINRGNNQEKIFLNDRDKEKFLEYLEKANERFSIIIHTYCIMSNHYHLLVETPVPNLSVAMQWINVSYATYFNRKRGRVGHLFQGRFKAILIDADQYLKHLSRYIHLNPVKAKLVPMPSKYKWSSYIAFIGKARPPAYLETNRLLSTFGKGKKEANQNYKDFVENTDITTLENPNKRVTGGFILGDLDFVNWIKDTYLSGRQDEKEIPQLKKLKPKVQLESIVHAVCAEFGCNRDQVITKGRKKNKAREVAIHLARELSGMSCKDLGIYFGGVSGALITMMYNRVTKETEKNKQLKSKIGKAKKQIFNI